MTITIKRPDAVEGLFENQDIRGEGVWRIGGGCDFNGCTFVSPSPVNTEGYMLVYRALPPGVPVMRRCRFHGCTIRGVRQIVVAGGGFWPGNTFQVENDDTKGECR